LLGRLKGPSLIEASNTEIANAFSTRFSRPQVEPIDVRRKRQAVEGAQAMKDYRRSQEVARERMAALKGQRLARRADLEKE